MADYGILEERTSERATLQLHQAIDGLHLEFIGEIDMRDPELALLDFLLRANGIVAGLADRKLFVDFTRLTYMNSSGIKLLITWLMGIRELPPEKQFVLIVHHDPESAWQTSCLPILQKILPDFVRIGQA